MIIPYVFLKGTRTTVRATNSDGDRLTAQGNKVIISRKFNFFYNLI